MCETLQNSRDVRFTIWKHPSCKCLHRKTMEKQWRGMQ